MLSDYGAIGSAVTSKMCASRRTLRRPPGSLARSGSSRVAGARAEAQADQPVERRPVFPQLPRRRTVGDLAALQHDGRVGEGQGDLRVLLREDARRALLARHAPDRAGELLDDG